jgi:hypothetical protein
VLDGTDMGLLPFYRNHPPGITERLPVFRAARNVVS